jgi:peroxiredoxin
LASLACFLLVAVASAVNYHLLYSIQVPAFERYVAIESREWKTQVGELAPEFEVVALDGSRVHSSDLRGNVVLINFFATWCGPCRVELPHLQKMWGELEANEGFHMLVIGREETPDSVAAFKSTSGFTFPVTADPDASAYHQFADEGIPRTYLVGRNGTLLYQSVGFADTDVYHQELARLREAIDQELAVGQ